MVNKTVQRDGTVLLTGGGLDQMWPVGSVYISVTNTNPGTIFGGTWAAFGTGQMLVGVDTAQTEFDTVLKTGGSKTKSVPAHTHTTPAHTHTDNFSMGAPTEVYANNTVTGSASRAGPNHTHPISGGVTSSGASTTGAASGATFVDLPPYVAVYMWRRTA